MSSGSDTEKPRKKISLKRFLSLLKHKPKWVGNDFDGVVLLQFRDFKGFSPSLEFYARPSENGAQRIYFEILDLNGCKDFDFIPLDSSRRKEVVHVGMTEYKKLLGYAKEIGYEDSIMPPAKVAEKIDAALTKLYSGRLG